MGAQTIRKIGNNSYLYYIYYENKKRREICCGPVDDPKSHQKLKNAKIMDLRKQKENITLQIRELTQSGQNQQATN